MGDQKSDTKQDQQAGPKQSGTGHGVQKQGPGQGAGQKRTDQEGNRPQEGSEVGNR
jgi:hypothetical protein